MRLRSSLSPLKKRYKWEPANRNNLRDETPHNNSIVQSKFAEHKKILITLGSSQATEMVNNDKYDEQLIARRRVKRMSELNGVFVQRVEVDEKVDGVAVKNVELVKKRSVKNIAHEHLTTLAHGCIVFFTLYIVYKSLAGYLNVFTMHPLFYGIGWMLLMTEAVMLFSKDNIFSSGMDRAKRIRIHWIFQTVGMVLSTIALIAAYVIIDEKMHFSTWHGITGLIAMILCYLACANGTATLYCMELKSYVSPKKNKIFHTSTGIATMLIGMVSMILSLYTNWFNYYVKYNLDIFYVSFMVVGCGLLWSIVRPSVTLYHRIKGT